MHHVNQNKPLVFASCTSNSSSTMPQYLKLNYLLLEWTMSSFFLNFGGQEQLTSSEYIWPESVAPPPMWNLLIPLETFIWLISELLWVGTHPRTCSAASTCYTRAHSIHAKENQSSISLSCDSRGQYILINVFHYYAYVFIFLMMDLGKKTPCIFCDRAVRHHQAIKNNTSHAYLYSTPNNISKYCLSRLITKSACGTQTGRTETC